ncbi:MAG: GntR family transcriptional regulator [Anaerovoracaceae bacterium]
MDMAVPAYIDVMQKIRKDIVSGALEPNQKLDSIKTLSERYNVNPNTMQKALVRLEKEGLLKSRRTAGKYITDNSLLIKSVRVTEARRIAEEFAEKMNRLQIQPEELKMLFSEPDLDKIIMQDIE